MSRLSNALAIASYRMKIRKALGKANQQELEVLKDELKKETERRTKKKCQVF